MYCKRQESEYLFQRCSDQSERWTEFMIKYLLSIYLPVYLCLSVCLSVYIRFSLQYSHLLVSCQRRWQDKHSFNNSTGCFHVGLLLSASSQGSSSALSQTFLSTTEPLSRDLMTPWGPNINAHVHPPACQTPEAHITETQHTGSYAPKLLLLVSLLLFFLLLFSVSVQGSTNF